VAKNQLRLTGRNVHDLKEASCRATTSRRLRG